MLDTMVLQKVMLAVSAGHGSLMHKTTGAEDSAQARVSLKQQGTCQQRATS